MNQQELADRLVGISLPGAKSRVQRARQKIRDELLACCHFEFDRYGRVIDIGRTAVAAPGKMGK